MEGMHLPQLVGLLWNFKDQGLIIQKCQVNRGFRLLRVLVHQLFHESVIERYKLSQVVLLLKAHHFHLQNFDFVFPRSHLQRHLTVTAFKTFNLF